MSYKLNPNLYVGNIKSKNGEIKILPGDKDNNIISKRNKILKHLNKVFRQVILLFAYPCANFQNRQSECVL